MGPPNRSWGLSRGQTDSTPAPGADGPEEAGTRTKSTLESKAHGACRSGGQALPMARGREMLSEQA